MSRLRTLRCKICLKEMFNNLKPHLMRISLRKWSSLKRNWYLRCTCPSAISPSWSCFRICRNQKKHSINVGYLSVVGVKKNAGANPLDLKVCNWVINKRVKQSHSKMKLTRIKMEQNLELMKTPKMKLAIINLRYPKLNLLRVFNKAEVMMRQWIQIA